MNAWRYPKIPSGETLIHNAKIIVKKNLHRLNKKNNLNIDYASINSIEKLATIEAQQRLFLNEKFNHEYHLFLKYYSGTWWSAEQCLWIDAIRAVANQYQHLPCYAVILCALLFAMTYTNPGIGHHYSLYRKATSDLAFKEMIEHRKKSLANLFIHKYNQILLWLPPHPSSHQHIITTRDYYECLQTFEGGVVYADPPYSNTQYSNFYHVLETLTRYDYPELQMKKNNTLTKARYRKTRHHSSFCLKSTVKSAFQRLFFGIANNGTNLILSYSNTGLIGMNELITVAKQIMPLAIIDVCELAHMHSSFGFNSAKPKPVKEYLMLVKQV